VVPLARISKISYYLDRRKNSACYWRVDFQDYAAAGPVGDCDGARSGKKFAVALELLSSAARQQVKEEYAKQDHNLIWPDKLSTSLTDANDGGPGGPMLQKTSAQPH
jgi:hypothetical protein